jgi:hypothetical protein
MVDKIESQSVEFTDVKRSNKTPTKPLMDIDTERAILESTKNYNKMVNDMFSVCSNICIKNFSVSKLTTQEEICIENCQKKFFVSYATGQTILDSIVAQVNKTDLFSNTKDVDIIQAAVDKVNKT